MVAKRNRSGAPFVLIPLLFVLAATAGLIGARYRQHQGMLELMKHPFASILPPSRISSSSQAPNDSLAQNMLDEQMLLGNPDKATGDASNREHFLMERAQYALSYNDSWHFPNWVAWHLCKRDIGEAERGQFVPDPDLPGNFTPIVPSDYNHTGYDRGQNCPSQDRSARRDDSNILLYMTNITPQRHEMRVGPWEKLEVYCRQLAQEGNELYIISGYGFKEKHIRVIGARHIAVPDFGWKIVVVLPEHSGDDRKRINRNTRVIAVQIPNVKGILAQPWTRYVVTAGEVERATELHFFETLPPGIAIALKSKRDDAG
jgi:endonuclease G